MTVRLKEGVSLDNVHPRVFFAIHFATITGKDEASCNKLRTMILKQVGGESNLNGTASKCVKTEPLTPIRP